MLKHGSPKRFSPFSFLFHSHPGLGCLSTPMGMHPQAPATPHPAAATPWPPCRSQDMPLGPCSVPSCHTLGMFGWEASRSCIQSMVQRGQYIAFDPRDSLQWVAAMARGGTEVALRP